MITGFAFLIKSKERNTNANSKPGVAIMEYRLNVFIHAHMHVPSKKSGPKNIH